MKIHALINYSIADLGMIHEWAIERGHTVHTTAVYENNKLPEMNSFDLLIILGGVMGAYEEEEHPWLKNEKEFILGAIENNKAILGICLGAQLIAEVLGGSVYPQNHQEIGWWPVHFLDQIKDFRLLKGLPKKLHFFQYHGDVFDLPKSDEMTWLAHSEATRNQAFIYRDKILGLQFHPEFNNEKLEEIVHFHEKDIEPGPFIQMPNIFLGNKLYVKNAKKALFTILDNFNEIIR